VCGFVEHLSAAIVLNVRFNHMGLSVVKPIYQLLVLLPGRVGTMIA